MKKLFLGLLLATATVFAVAPQTAHAQVGGGQPGEHVEAQVVDMQWRRSQDPDVDASYHPAKDATLIVTVGTELVFRAVKDDPAKPWSPGRPTWSGSSGASGTTPAVTVKFSVPSTSSTDYKTVVVEASGNSKITANVVVTSLTLITTPDDDWPARSQRSFGVTEGVTCSVLVSPLGVSASQIGNMTWIKGGSGSLTNVSSGIATLTVGVNNESLTLILKITSGPCADQTFSVSRSIVLPNVGYVDRHGSSKQHFINQWSTGFLGLNSIGPKDVSFKGLQVGEGQLKDSSNNVILTTNNLLPTTATTSGWLKDVGLDGLVHDPGPNKPTISEGAQGNVWSYYDTITSGAFVAGSPSPYNPKIIVPPYADGTFNWSINWFILPKGSIWKYFTSVNHTMISDSSGKATIQKGETSVDALLTEPTQVLKP